MKKLKIILKYNLKTILFLVILLSFLYSNIYSPKSKYTGKETYIEGYVISKSNKSIVIKGKEKIIVKLNKKYNINYHDYIGIKGYIYEPSTNTNFNMFNYKKYLKTKRINYCFNESYIKIIKRNRNIFYIFKNYIDKRINKLKSKNYVYVFVMGNKNEIDDDIKKIYKDLGIIHLLSISGSYISILILILKRIIKKDNIIIFILLFYVVFTNFQISIIRSCLCYIFLVINRQYNIGFTSKELLYILVIVLLLINPFYILDIGFLLSFIIYYSLLHFKDFYKDDNKYTKSIKISLICFLSSLPIIINSYYSINLLSVIYNLVFIPFSTLILYPLSILTVIIPFLDSALLFLINIYEYISISLSNIKVLTLSFSKIPLFLSLIYYLLLFLNNRYLIIYIIILYLNNYYLFIPRLYFIDVGQGDSALIRYKNKNILIDTGGLYYYDNSYNLSMFYKSVGVKKIDYLITTHGDFDHIGYAKNIINYIPIKNVIFNCDSYNDLEKELIKKIKNKNINYYSCLKDINIKNTKLYFLQNKIYEDENNNSNVIYLELNNKKLLFMGDAGINEEQDIISNYDISNIDILKVGHHGSKTSSSKEFINKIKPKFSVISVGKNNRYGHPNKEVLNNLKDSKIYRTDQDGSIMFEIKNNKLKIETCLP